MRHKLGNFGVPDNALSCFDSVYKLAEHVRARARRVHSDGDQQAGAMGAHRWTGFEPGFRVYCGSTQTINLVPL